jgi:hypothetical protein
MCPDIGVGDQFVVEQGSLLGDHLGRGDDGPSGVMGLERACQS